MYVYSVRNLFFNLVWSQVRLFADDCLLYRSVKTQQDQQQLQTDLHSLERWATKWGMCFNATKCYFMSIHISRNPLTTHYILNNHILEHVQENLYLGVIISKNLKWSTYINKICNKANSTLGFIRRNLKHCNRKFTVWLFKYSVGPTPTKGHWPHRERIAQGSQIHL